MTKPLARGALCFLAVFLVVWSAATHWLAWRFGMGIWPVPNGTPWPYQLESGFIPALTAASLVTLVAGAWHHVNCHAGGCWRIGKHKVDGTPWCSRHHEAALANSLQQVTLDTISVQLAEIIALMKAA